LQSVLRLSREIGRQQDPVDCYVGEFNLGSQGAPPMKRGNRPYLCSHELVKKSVTGVTWLGDEMASVASTSDFSREFGTVRAMPVNALVPKWNWSG
jgi:hypothetical protein